MWFQSAALASGKGLHCRSLSSMELQSARTMIQKHFDRKTNVVSELISWTSSFLFALHFAIQEELRGKKNIRLCALDTHNIDTTKICSAEDLLVQYNVIILSHDDDAEFLAYGELYVRGCSGTTSLNALKDLGLLAAVPYLSSVEETPPLGSPLEALRPNLFKEVAPISRPEANAALLLASGFGEEWALILAVAILAFQARDERDLELLCMASDLAGKHLLPT